VLFKDWAGLSYPAYNWTVGKKQKKYLKIIAVALVIIGGLHFVPIYSRTGYINYGPNAVCIGSDDPNFVGNDNHRVILLGLSGFNDEKNRLTDDTATCGPHVHLHLYIL